MWRRVLEGEFEAKASECARGGEATLGCRPRDWRPVDNLPMGQNPRTLGRKIREKVRTSGAIAVATSTNKVVQMVRSAL